MSKSQIVEEPCEVKVSRTVLKTSMKGDFLAEFNIKSRTLSDFNRLVASVQARGVEPATGIFVPEFVRHSGQKPDETGVLKPINYYSLVRFVG